MGGLTVLKALRNNMPKEDFIYLGDTARLPYGTKSESTINRYALQASRLLVEQDIKALVVACNTASSFSLEALVEAYFPLPVYGVIEPGAEAACAVADETGILVLATESTVRAGAYQRLILQKKTNIPVFARACPLWVTLAEQGLTDRELTNHLIEYYLQGFSLHRPKTLLLGCTHFPLLLPALRQICGGEWAILDSAETTAVQVKRELKSRSLLKDQGGGVRYMATDGVERFARIGRQFMGEDLHEVVRVDL